MSKISSAEDRTVRIPPMVRSLRLAFRAGGLVAPSLAARAAGALFRLAPRRRTSDFERQVLGTGRLRFLETTSGRLATWQWGDGRAILLVHGWGSRGARLGSFVEPIVAAGCSAVTFDAPGEVPSAFLSWQLQPA